MNNANTACTGLFFTGFFAEAPSVSLSNFSSGIANTLQCQNSADVPGNTDTAYVFCLGDSSIAPGGTLQQSVQVTPSANAPATIPIIGLTEQIDENDPTGNNYTFVYAFANASLPTCTPTIATPPITQSGIDYTVSWTETTDPTSYQVDESSSADFSANVTSKTVSGTSTTFVHTVATNTSYYYRVHALTCSGGPGPLSSTVKTVVQAPPPPTSKNVDTVVPFGSTKPVTFQIFIPGPTGKTALDTSTYTATTDRSFLTVTPPSGPLPPGGTTVTVTAQPVNLPPGANTGTVTVTPSNGAPTNTPVSVSLVTPVSLGGKALPPGNALIIPVVTHVNSGVGPFQSDVRVTNASASPINYQVTFTPSNTDGTQNGKITNISIDPGRTIALNDIAKDFFGYGATGDPNDVGFGALEIRPINNSSTLTYASSRTFANTSIGTYGQFVAALPFAQFAGPAVSSLFGQPSTGPTVLSLQQVAESAKFRTNLGLVEGSGTPASGHIRIFDDLGNLLKEVPYSLKPGENQFIQHFISGAGVPNLEDGRIEITVESSTGAVTAYASVLDNTTADPLEVTPVQASQVNAQRYIVPGMAEIVTPFSNFHSDMRIYNGGTTSVNVTPTFFPQGGSPVTVAPITIGKGEVKAYDNVLPTLFNVTNAGGSVILTTSDNSSLVATGRTYSFDSKNGTFGQFIPGVSPSQGIGVGDKPLQILQLEQSSQFRSNVGITELTGNKADVKITIIPSDGRTSAVITLDDAHGNALQPNEFRQFNKVIESAYGTGAQMYNARVVVEVTGGTGRVSAYASVLDNSSLDPTYVPAQ